MITKSQVKYIQSLGQKKLRDEDAVFVAEGTKIINELLEAGNITTVALYGTGTWLQQFEARQNKPAVETVEAIQDHELERISFLNTPNQVLGLFKQPVFDHNIPFANNLTLLLDGIQDPGNLGTIIRIADWFGIKQIVAGKESVDVFNPKVVQSTMASIARVKVLYEDIETVIAANAGIDLYATTLQGKPVQQIGKIKEGMLLIGNESKGLQRELIEKATHQVTIPRIGGAESLNAAVATGIILSHICLPV